MSRNHLRALAALGVLLALALVVPTSLAQITGVAMSDVEGFFGSQSDAFQLSEGPIAPPWGANPVGPYPLTGPPTVPPLYAGFPNPTLPITSNIPDDSGHFSPVFSDIQGTNASYSIIGNFAGGAFTGDAFAKVAGPPMTLFQPVGATGFAYEEANFAMAYSVGPAGILTGAAPAYPFTILGSVLPGGYAQFGAEVNYWWVPVIPGTIIPSGPATNLGSLQYSFLQPTGGPFSGVVNHAATVLAGATGTGFLEITGNMFVAGDPFSISVSSVPEPSTAMLATLGLSVLALAGRRRFVTVRARAQRRVREGDGLPAGETYNIALSVRGR